MTEQARKARNRYLREWRKQNPEKFQAQIERYWEKKAASMQEEQQPKPEQKRSRKDD